MQAPTPPHSNYTSPKRKRGEENHSPPHSFTSRLRTNDLQPSPATSPDSKTNSPRTTVATQLQTLHLHQSAPMPKLDLSKALTTDHTIAHKRAKPTPSPKATLSPQITTISPKKTPTPPPSPPTKSPAPTLEIPETPILAPTTSPSHLLSRTPSPLPSNPPPNLWWSDSEITGHDPKDPTDDGYGINGVGFIPTPAIAAARHERRKRQLVEYKNRQDREARQRRGERRRRMDREGSGVGDAGKEVARKVRFLEI